MKTTGWIVLLLIALTACGGAGTDKPGKAAPTAPTTASAAGKTSVFTVDPVQLTVDPCTLVTQPEAQQVIGQPATQGRNGKVCTYVANGNGGHIAVETQAPAFCKLLFLELKRDIFGGDQVRVNDLGDGGMLVKGNGNVQFVSHGGCVGIDASVGDKHPADDTMLAMGRTAAGRVG